MKIAIAILILVGWLATDVFWGWLRYSYAEEREPFGHALGRLITRRHTLRLISQCLVLGVWIYYSPHYRTVVQSLIAVAALIVAVAVILTVFPYEKTPSQANDKTSPKQ